MLIMRWGPCVSRDSLNAPPGSRFRFSAMIVFVMGEYLGVDE